MCAQKLANSQLNLLRGTKQKKTNKETETSTAMRPKNNKKRGICKCRKLNETIPKIKRNHKLKAKP